MKRIGIVLCMLLFIISNTSAQQQRADGKNIKELMEIELNTDNGIALKDYPEGRTGIADYEIISNDEVALLCNVEKKIKIYNIETGLISNQFSINHYPRKLTYESIKQRFYILDCFGKVYEYSLDGTPISSFEINEEFKFFERLESFNGNVYLLSANQNTFQLTNNGIILGADEQLQSRVTGWILSENVYGRTNIKDANTYTVEIRNNSTVVISKDFSTSERIDVGTIRLIGSSGNLFYLMLDYVLPKNLTRAGRRLIVFSRETESIVQQFDLPNINYSVVHNDIKAFGEQLFHLLITPQNAVLFEPFYESFNKKVNYPDKYNYEYFDNDEPDDSSPIEQIEIHENNSDTLKQSGKDDPTNSAIMGSQIVDRAYNYMQLSWIASEYNIAEIQGTNVTTTIWVEPNPPNPSYPPGWYDVLTPNWISSTSNNTTTPYKWGGWTHFDKFVEFAGNATVASEIYTGDAWVPSPASNWPYEMSDNNVIGVDCSGFVSRAWNRAGKLGTTSIPNVSQSIGYGNLQRGDVLNHYDHHVRLFLYRTGDVNSGTYYCIESSMGEEAVNLDNYTYATLINGGYLAWRYNNREDYDLVYENFDIPQDEIFTGGYLTVITDIANQGNQDVTTSFKASVYSMDDSFLFDIGTFQNTTINIDETEQFVFHIDNIPTNINPGNYKLLLRFEKTSGFWSTIPKEDYLGPEEIEISAPDLQANFTYSPPTGPPGTQVVFNNQSTGNINHVSWDISKLYGTGGDATFENGTGSTSINPIINFGQPSDFGDIYIVELSVSDDGLYWATETKSIPICEDNKSCNDSDVDFYATVNGIMTTQVNVGENIVFHDNSSITAVGWLWEFPGGNTDNPYIGNPSVTYNSPGIYDVTLHAIPDVVSCPVPCASKSNYIEVLDSGGPLLADFNCDAQNVIVNESVNFFDQSIGDPETWQWGFSPSSVGFLNGTSSNSQNPEVEFFSPGFYTVELTVTNTNGSDTETKVDYISVSNSNVQAIFSPSNPQLQEGYYVEFNDESIGDIISWVWVFEGGSPSSYSGQDPGIISYWDAGVYNVSLTVSDGYNTDMQSGQVEVCADDFLIVHLSVSPNPVVVYQNCHFSSEVSGLCGSGNFTYQWYVNDQLLPYGGTDSELTYLFENLGEYSVYVNIWDVNNLVEFESNHVLVQVESEPDLNSCFHYNGNGNIVQLGDQFNIYDCSTSNIELNWWNIYWNYEGASGTQNISSSWVFQGHTYNQTGRYQIRMKISGTMNGYYYADMSNPGYVNVVDCNSGIQELCDFSTLTNGWNFPIVAQKLIIGGDCPYGVDPVVPAGAEVSLYAPDGIWLKDGFHVIATEGSFFEAVPTCPVNYENNSIVYIPSENNIEDYQYVNPLSLNSNGWDKSFDYKIYPNPTTNKLNIYFNKEISGSMEIELKDAMGKTLYFHKGEMEKHKTLDLATYPKGIYLLKIKTREKVFVEKVIRQ